MGKIYTYTIILVGLVLFLKIAGIPTGVDDFLSRIGFGDVTDIRGSQFVIALVALFSVSVGGAIIIGFFGRTAPEYTFLAVFATANMILFISTIASIINHMPSTDAWIYYPIFLILGAYGIGFVIALIEWVYGREA